MYRASILDHVAKWMQGVESINEAIKKRANRLLDYDAKKSKVKRLIERPASDAATLPKVGAGGKRGGPSIRSICGDAMCVRTANAYTPPPSSIGMLGRAADDRGKGSVRSRASALGSGATQVSGLVWSLCGTHMGYLSASAASLASKESRET